MNKSHQIQLNPSKVQKILLHKSFGCNRHSYNWALDKWNELYSKGEKPNAMILIKLQNSIKKDNTPFYKEVNKCAVQYAIWDVEDAWKRYFNGLKDGTIESGKKKYIAERKRKGLPINDKKLKEFGKPKFKKKDDNDSYVAVENSVAFKQSDFKIHLPRIGKVKCHENLRFEGKVNNVVVKRIADKYFAVVNLITNENPMICENQATVGVDLGIKTLLVCSDGTIFENPKALKSNIKSLKRLQRGLSRKVKGSNNRKKQQMRVAKKHYRISCIRKNAIHNATSYLVNNYGKIVIEDLNVKGMLKNRKLSQAISDASFGEFKLQLEYKTKWNGIELLKADRFFASSKTCSCCGHKKEILKLSERIFTCEKCNHTQDRDLNASINLANYSPTPKHGESNACGDFSSVGNNQLRKSKKQEILLNRYESNIKH